MNSIWPIPKKTPELIVLFDFQHVWPLKKWPFCSHCEQNQHLGRYLSWYGVVKSYKTHLGDVALILLYLQKICHACALKIGVSISVVRWVFKVAVIHAPLRTKIYKESFCATGSNYWSASFLPLKQIPFCVFSTMDVPATFREVVSGTRK